jgi:cyclopropane fatty-acyl-phospholipid synthase-like methyltransferase
MNTNIPVWQALHAQGYFKNHPYYQGGARFSGDDVERVSEFYPLKLASSENLAVIGSGYGRETLLLAPFFRLIYCIDIDLILFSDLKRFLEERNVRHFIPILIRDGWDSDITDELDCVYSRNVFQHLTRDLTIDYFKKLSLKLRKDTGRFVFQFCECHDGGERDVNPGRIYEPQINWTRAEIESLCSLLKLKIHALKSVPINQRKHHFHWHWLSAGTD